VLEGILDSDGADNGTITTASKQLQDDISKLMILCGKNPANYERPARKMYFKSEDRFIVGKYPEYGVRAYTENRGYRRNAFTLAKYDGKVWCLEMEDNHNFLVYRNGAYTFSGNTSEEFGCVVNNGPQNEETKIAPRSPYGCAKAAARYLVNTYRESFNLYCIQGWSFNFESKLRGSKYLTKKVTENVARIYHSIKRNNWNFEPLRVGNIYTYRSWQHASDVADGVWRMLNQDKFRTDWQNRQGVTLPKEIKQYVLSESETHSAKEFIQKAFLEAGIEGVWGNKTTEVIDEKFLLLKDNQTIPLVEISKEFFRPSDVTFLFGDSTLARKELGWSPKISFDEIIKEMVRADIKRQEFKN
jgi:GDP-mannose 4,6-dehydratase